MSDRGSTTGTPRWVKVFGIIALVVVLLLILLLIFGGGEQGRGRHIPFAETGNQTPPIEHTPSEGRSGHTAPEDGYHR